MDNTTENSKVVSLKLSDYAPVLSTEKVDRGGWVNFGEKNLFPNYLRELSETSPVHGALCISIADMIAGKSLNAGKYQSRIESLDTYNVFYGCAHDLKKYGGYYIEVIYTLDKSGIAKIKHIPFEECRIAIDIDTEDIIGVYHSDDWSAIKKKKNKPVYIPKFNPSNKANEGRQMYWCFNYTSGQIYPRPDYWSAVNYIELSKQIGIYHCSNILSGLFPSFIVNFYNGETDIEKQRKMMQDWENKLSGSRNAGKFIMTFNEPDTQKVDVVPFPLSDADKQYEFLSEESRKEVMIAHRITTPLLFGIRDNTGFGSNKDEMETGLQIFINQVIEPYQRKLTTGLETILSVEMPDIQIAVVQNTPLKTQQMIADETQSTNGDVSGTALNGAQISSMIEILIQSATGVLPVPSAKAVMKASFPTLTDQQVDDIFTGISSGSVNPNEIAMTSLQTMLHHLSGKKKEFAEVEESYQPTEEMKASAELGLKWREEHGRGGTAIGVARARDISNMKNLSIDTIKRMNSYFSRHEIDKEATGWNDGEEGFPTAGRIAWELWGGDAGQSWSARIVERIKKEEKLSLDDSADLLIELGEEQDEDWILIDTFKVDYDTDEAENEELESIELHELATRVVKGTPNKISEQDKRIDNKLFITRYRYRGETTSKSRPFCRKMMNADLLYRKEDIVAMENKVVNSGWGAEGEDTYSIWLTKHCSSSHNLYKGGGHCHHFWQKEVYISSRKAKIDLESPSAQRIAVAKAEKMGYKVRNESLVAKLPTDMDYHGFLPTNPIWGANGSAYNKE
jgi:hypothetical protein